MKIKVCGITSVEQLQQLHDLGVDHAGMIFFEGSKRYVGNKVKGLEEAVRAVPISKVGVFVNAGIDTVMAAVESFGLSAVQLHGDEDEAFGALLRNKTTVIKVFRVSGEENIDELIAPFLEHSDYFLFDTATPQYGGSGKKFNWAALAVASVNKPFFLSGGIGPDDIEALNSFKHPHLYAVDVNSGFEIAPGVKDMNKVAHFINNLVK